MANLQANLRSQCTAGAPDPQRLLRSANQLFYESTADAAYATLFFSEYNDEKSQLTYINCGHPPPILFRSDGSLEHLESSSTVLGLFKDWDCSVQTIRLNAGDVLVLYSDGITESANAVGEEFGRDRLIELVRRHRASGVREIVSEIVEEVGRFSDGEQQDDITAIVAKRN